LAVSGVVLFVAMLGVSAALAPSIGSTPSEGYQERTLVGSQGGGPGWHQYGSVYLLNGSSVVWREDAAESYFDVTRTENGTVLAGFMDGGYEACGPYESPCVRTGFQVIDSDSGEVRPGYSFPVRTRTNSEVHDVEQLQSGEYLLTDMEYERIFTVKDGEVTWQWNASSFYDAPADPTRTDWLHINDVDVIDNGRYLVSVRNANQLLIVERGDGVVEVINEDRSNRNDDNCRQSGQLRDTDSDGDIRCGDPAVLNHQHNPQWLGEEAVLVADSDNDRVVELHKQDGEWQPSWTLTRTGGIALDWPRDADRLPNGNTLITDTLNRRIVEVNENGTVVWSYQTKRIPYEADRLPVGETVGGPQSDTSSVDDPGSEGSIPGLSILLVGLRALYPGLPFWFGEIQLLGTFISIGLTLSGGALHVRQRR
jgi:hypothetical protein